MLGERHFRFTKYCLYDSSVRVPLLLAGGALPAAMRGTMDDRPAELVDVVPTLIRVAGTNPAPELPGLDLLGSQRRPGAFCEYHDGKVPAYMWRTPEWKLILFFDQPMAQARVNVASAKGELYDLHQDPHEWNNLYHMPEHAAVREKLKTELLMHLACVHAAFPMGRG
jgi:arylsulfatase A-like enzyme